MAWNTNTITEPLIAAGAAVAVIAITFITALIDDFRRYLDFLPCLKAGDSYSGWLNEALRFGGFPLHGRPRCDRLAPVSVLRRLHGRLTTP